MNTETEVQIEIPPWPKEGAPRGLTEADLVEWRKEHPCTLEGLREIAGYNSKLTEINLRDIWSEIDALKGWRTLRAIAFPAPLTWRSRLIIWLLGMTPTLTITAQPSAPSDQPPMNNPPHPAAPPQEGAQEQSPTQTQ